MSTFTTTDKFILLTGVRKTGNYRINMKDGVKVDPYEVKCDFTGATGFSTGLCLFYIGLLHTKMLYYTIK